MSSGGSTVLNIRLDEKGKFIDEWPERFFEEAYLETIGDTERFQE